MQFSDHNEVTGIPLVMRASLRNDLVEPPDPPYDARSQISIRAGGKDKSKSTRSSSTKEGLWDRLGGGDSDWGTDD